MVHNPLGGRVGLFIQAMFAKIFSQIYDSSIVENPEARFTFMDLLVLCDVDGVVDMTHEAIARRTNRPLEIVRSTIAELEGPDPRSRTPDNDGRRIVRLDEHRDWGWMIVNYARFRATASEEQRRAKTAARTRAYKARKHQQNSEGDAVVTHGDAGDAMQKQKQRQKQMKKEPIQSSAKLRVDKVWFDALVEEHCPLIMKHQPDFFQETDWESVEHPHAYIIGFEERLRNGLKTKYTP